MVINSSPAVPVSQVVRVILHLRVSYNQTSLNEHWVLSGILRITGSVLNGRRGGGGGGGGGGGS